MQMMYGMEQSDVELLLRDMEGNEISVSDNFNRELELREVDPEEDDPEDEDDPEVFVIDEKEESRDEIVATESWKFLKAANTRWKQPRKIMQRGASASRSPGQKEEENMMQCCERNQQLQLVKLVCQDSTKKQMLITIQRMK